MATVNRFVKSPSLDYCLSPRIVYKNDKKILVPCGHCDGCHLHKSNSWSMRVASEIEANPYSVFFTLTYSNKYLPTLKAIYDGFGAPVFTSNHRSNIRFNGVRDVLRDDNIVIRSTDPRQDITNLSKEGYVNYASKRDIQLWLKNVREDIKQNLKPYESNSIRYYIISEVGPTTHRCHYHGIIFCKDKEISEYLIRHALYKNWKMCSEVRFFPFVKYCDSQTANYVSSYVAGLGRLPKIYQNVSIRPFRLSSKSPAIGYKSFDRTKIFEDVASGVVEYNKTISRIDRKYIFRYPSDYLRSLFPKCFEYSSLDFQRLLWLYGLLYREIKGCKRPYLFISHRLCAYMHASDWQATKKCYDVCEELGCTPFHYLYLLDMSYYKSDMFALKSWYQWQEIMIIEKPLDVLASYINLFDIHLAAVASLKAYNALNAFFEGFAIDYQSMEVNDIKSLCSFKIDTDKYQKEIDDVVTQLTKIPKYNEMAEKVKY